VPRTLTASGSKATRDSSASEKCTFFFKRKRKIRLRIEFVHDEDFLHALEEERGDAEAVRRGGGGVEGEGQVIVLNASFQSVEYKPPPFFPSSWSRVACEMRM
jgi:hypothetical protein